MAAGGAELSSGGPGLMFIYLLNVFNGMPGGKICGVVFYVCVLFAGMSSLVNLYEAPVETLQERLGLKRPAAVAVIAAAGCGVALFIQGIVSDWMDVVSIYICPLGAMLAGIMFFWVAGKDVAVDAVNRGRKKENWKLVCSPWKVCAGSSCVYCTCGRRADGGNWLRHLEKIIARTVFVFICKDGSFVL